MNTLPQSERVRELAEKILPEVTRPKDHWEIAARLEVSGIRDLDAQQEYGAADVFDLAKLLLTMIEEVPSLPPPPSTQAPLVWRFLKGYSKGLLFSMPMVVQIFAMILLGYALWAWVDFTVPEATAIGLGTAASFVVTGGFTQAIGRRGLFYTYQQAHILAKKITYRFFRIGLLVMLAGGLGLFLLNLVYGFFSLTMGLYSGLYYFLLSILWLSLTVLYMLRQHLLFTLATALGILIVHYIILFSDWGMVVAHAVGLIVAILLSTVTGWMILSTRAHKSEEAFSVSELPRNSILAYTTGPYFTYGVLYFSFLFVDRILAWSSETGRGFLAYFIWFDSRYELGMDWALFCFQFTVGVLEFVMQEFSDRILPAEQVASAERISTFNRQFSSFYYRHLILFLVVSLLSIVVAYVGMLLLRRSGVFPFIEVFFNPITRFVFWWAAVGYVLLVWGLFNSNFLFALSRPIFVLRALGCGLLVNLLSGLVLSRVLGFEMAVIGMTLGALTFLLVSSYYTRQVFRNLDYYYYSAY